MRSSSEGKRLDAEGQPALDGTNVKQRSDLMLKVNLRLMLLRPSKRETLTLKANRINDSQCPSKEDGASTSTQPRSPDVDDGDRN